MVPSKTPSVYRPTEEQVQQTIVAYCALSNVFCLQTTVRKVRGGYGATPGVPDLLVSKKTWPRGFWLGVEVKGPVTRLSAQQKELEQSGRIVVVRSLDDFVNAMREAQEAINGIGRTV